MDFKDQSLIIVKDTEKTNFLKKLRSKNPFIDVKVMGLKEFIKNYFFDFNEETIYRVSKQFNVVKEVAEIYIKNLYYIEPLEDEKITFLISIKTFLEEKNLLIKNTSFIKSLKDKTIYLYNIKHIDKFYESVFSKLAKHNRIEYINLTSNFFKTPLYKLPNKEIEVAFVASEISKLIKNGIDINKIKLANVSDDYTFILKKTFKEFHIPLILKNSVPSASTILLKKFKDLYSSDLSNTLENIKPFVKTRRDEKLYKKIIDCLNNYNWCNSYEEVKDFIFDDLDKITIEEDNLKNAVRTIDFTNTIIEDEEYVFLINFNQGIIPKSFKDEDYLNDNLKSELGLSTSIDLNINAILNVQETIMNTKNLIVTYSERNLNGELYISNAYKEDLFEEKKYNIEFIHSNNYNKNILLGLKDENRKYGTITEKFKILNHHYLDEPYLTFDNRFKGISKSEFKLDKLTLSYSSMNTFYMCAFRYYLDNILKVNNFEDTFEKVIGNIFHDILSKAFTENFDFEKSWQASIEKTNYNFTKSNQFFLSLLKEELLFIIQTINEQLTLTSLHKAFYEQKIEIPIYKDRNVSFKGFVDKILYDTIEGETIAAIIDYKTGNPEINLDNVIHGLDMQLPIYAYLIRNFEPLKNAKIGGLYLQKILTNKKTLDEKKSALKLQGYSNSSLEILNLVDSSYENSQMIKSMKTTSKGLSSYAKVLSDDEINILIELVHKKITEATEDILDAKFTINPKELEGQNYGCKFCKYHDICYMKNKDIVKKKKQSAEYFLGGDRFANVD